MIKLGNFSKLGVATKFSQSSQVHKSTKKKILLGRHEKSRNHASIACVIKKKYIFFFFTFLGKQHISGSKIKWMSNLFIMINNVSVFHPKYPMKVTNIVIWALSFLKKKTRFFRHFLTWKIMSEVWKISQVWSYSH